MKIGEIHIITSSSLYQFVLETTVGKWFFFRFEEEVGLI